MSRTPEGQLKDACGKIARVNRLVFWQVEGKGINGIPDTVAGHASAWGGVVFVEFKTPDGRLTRQQEIRIDQLRQAGQRVAVCRSVEDYKRAVGLTGGDEL